jgi:flagellar hook-associated protein 2
MIRITGMNSGLDTESIISELVSAQSYKKQKIVKDQTKLSWKQTAWKTLNSKIFSFHQKTLSNMRFSDAYKKKATKVSNPNAVSVVSGSNAVDGVQTLKVDKLAKSGYLTGAELTDDQGKRASYTSTTKLSEMTGMGLSEGDSLSFTLTTGDKTTDISLSGASTIGDVVSQLKKAGVNASFDETNQRFFISATSTGEKADFALAANDRASFDVLTKLGINKVDADNENDKTKALYREYLASGDAAKIEVANYALGNTAESPVFSEKATRISGSNAEIKLNGADFSFESNTFTVNGLTFSVNEKTDSEVTLTTSTDYDGIYDQIKSFLKSYNELINEISTLYGADSADKYQPLTSEEKKAMSDDEVEEWEKKIKDSLLRKDSSLGSIQDTLSQYMQAGIQIGDKKFYLSDFGINTGSYFDTT